MIAFLPGPERLIFRWDYSVMGTGKVGSEVQQCYEEPSKWVAILYVDGKPYCRSAAMADAAEANATAQEMIDWYLAGGRQ